MDLIIRAVPEPTLEETIDKVRAGLRHAASLGVTTLQDMTTSGPELRAYQALRAAGELTARIYSIQNRPIDSVRETGVMTGFGDDWLRIGGIKISRTARWARRPPRSSSRTGSAVDERSAHPRPGGPRAGDLRCRRRRVPGHRSRYRRPRQRPRPRRIRAAVQDPGREGSARPESSTRRSCKEATERDSASWT